MSRLMRGVKVVGLVLSVVLCSATVFAQVAITGVVRDTSGAVLPGVTVEASSPALIEKVRSAVTNEMGEYRIIDLRQGTYAVTFSLSGFSTTKREGILLEGTFTATLNIDLKVGSLAETITVQGEAPTVDVQSSKRTLTLSSQALNDLPTARTYTSYVMLVPTINPGTADVQATPQMIGFSAPGGNQGRLLVDGLSVATAINPGVSLYVPDTSNASELTVTTSGAKGELEIGGPTVNVVPRSGGNTFSGTVFASGSPSSLIGTNYSSDLQAAGLATPGKYLKIWDYNGGVGGPISRDRIWFFANARNDGAYQSISNLYMNLNAGDSTKWLKAPDTSTLAQYANSYLSMSARLTVQLTARNKIAGFWDEQLPCNGGAWADNAGGCRGRTSDGALFIGGLNAGTAQTGSPETSTYNDHHQRVHQVSWSSPLSNKFLVEAAYGDFINPWGKFLPPGSPVGGLIPVTELCSAGCPNNGGIAQPYRAPYGAATPGANTVQDSWLGQYNWRASATYVTGHNSAKVGYQGTYYNDDTVFFGSTELGGNIGYNFQNGVPFQITQNLRPLPQRDGERFDGIYAQDEWTLGRFTLQGGVRYDHLWTFYPDQQIGPNRFLPTAIVFSRNDYPGTSYHDLTPRVGGAVDVFGNGKTAVRVSLGRYLAPAGIIYPFISNNPTRRLAGSDATRSWTDNNRNFVADCNLGLVTAQSPTTTGSVDTCGALSNQFFGTTRFTNNFDSGMLSGFNVRPGDWSFDLTLQQQLMPRVSVEGGYSRRWLVNYLNVYNALVPATSFNAFSVAVPNDPRLGADAGKTMTGLYTVNPSNAGLSDSTNVRSNDLGTQFQHYDGFNMMLSARPRGGLTVQAGFNTGHIVQDNCDIRSRYPSVSAGNTPAPPTSLVNPYCHVDLSWVSRYTAAGSYVIPRVEVLVALAFRSDQGQQLAANQTGVAAPAGQAFLGATTATINYLTPGSMYGNRVNELDFNFSKIVRISSRTKLKVGIDIYNVVNSAAVLVYNNNYAPTTVSGAGGWLAPQQVLTPRYAKLLAQFDF